MNLIYTYLRALSIDVMLGACFTSYLIGVAAGVTIPSNVYIILALSVWLIYTFDHLMDAKNIKKPALTFRHEFHQKYYLPLTIIWLVVSVSTTLYSLIVFSNTLIMYGLAVTGVCVLHLIFVKIFGQKISPFIQKEVGVAIGFTAGVSVAPLYFVEQLELEVVIVVLNIFLLAMINLLQFAWFEYEIDTRQGHTSFVRNIGHKQSYRVITGLIVISFCVSGFLYFIEGTYIVQLILLLMNLVLLLTFTFPNYFKKQERYRVYGDMIFSFPLILYLWQTLI